ncbi:MAG: allophanate hydrolase subunit 1 [Fimbriiglobus sp.]|jgi:inhibitor of KinA|nr:allophanate hydrolase subunit 1 [Fimbriiglobus sp.]
MKLVPLGDQALLAYCTDEPAAVRFAAAVQNATLPWLLDVVPAYASVGVYFDADAIRLAEVVRILEALPVAESAVSVGRRHIIPVSYERGPDLGKVAEHLALSVEQVIGLHTSAEFTVHAIGFVPGFPYLGYLPAELCGVPRLGSPRVRVEPGSVGLTGRQTGIYPLPRPGGWHLIGRTPLTLVDVAAGYFPLRVGDRVQFERIDEAEYRRREGERL